MPEPTLDLPEPHNKPDPDLRRLVQLRRFVATTGRAAARALHRAGLAFTVGYILGAGSAVAVVIWLARELGG